LTFARNKLIVKIISENVDTSLYTLLPEKEDLLQCLGHSYAIRHAVLMHVESEKLQDMHF